MILMLSFMEEKLEHLLSSIGLWASMGEAASGCDGAG